MRTDRYRGAWPLVAALLAGAVAAGSPASAQPPEAALDEPFLLAGELDREELVAAVLRRNPGLEAARQALRAASTRTAQASANDGPMAQLGVAPGSLGAEVPFGYEVELSQVLVSPGRRRLRGESAAAEAEEAGEELTAASLALVTRASLLFVDLYVAERALEVNAEHLALVGEFQRVATARYAAGLAPQQDPLRAESELAHLRHDGIQLGTERDLIVAEINALLHRPPTAGLPPPPRRLPAPPALPEGELEPAELAESALAASPELRRLEARVRARRSELELARLGRRPDFGVFASYNSMWSDSEHRFMVGGSVSLPATRSQASAATVEAEARLAQAESERAAVADGVRRELFRAATRWREAHHVLELFEGRLLPAASDQAQAARAAFETGQSGFLDLIEAERGLRGAKLEFHQALADLHRRRVELDAAMGRLPEPAPRAGDRAEAPSASRETR